MTRTPRPGCRGRASARSSPASKQALLEWHGSAQAARGLEHCYDRLEQFVGTLRRNDGLLGEFDRIAANLGRAYGYLSQPGRNRALADANLAHWLARYAASLAGLRQNQLQAHSILGRRAESAADRAPRFRVVSYAE